MKNIKGIIAMGLAIVLSVQLIPSAGILVRAQEENEKDSQSSPKILMSQVQTAAIKDQTYTVRGSQPKPQVKYGKVTLKVNRDYTLSYKDNKKIGTGTIYIKGKGNYTGTISRTFRIVKKKVPIRKKLVPKNKYSMKCPYGVNVKYITIHNTAEDLNALDQINEMIRRPKEVSFHYAVDEKEVVQGILENRNAWHAGNRTGNLNSLSIEICYSKSGGTRFLEAEDNAAKLAADLLNKYHLGIDKLRTHKSWSGKNCPQLTMELGWNRFVNMVKTYMKDSKNRNTALTGTVAVKKTNSKGSKPKAAYTGGSLITYLKSVGQDSSFANRKKLAAKNKIKNYKGTAAQNTKLLNILRNKRLPKKNSVYTVGGIKYKVTYTHITKGTVQVAGTQSKKLKAAAIPAKVMLKGYYYKVNSIGAGAFNSCKLLKNITVKTTALKSVGKNALKGIHKKAVIKVPYTKLKAYKKLFKGKGQSKSVKITKI